MIENIKTPFEKKVLTLQMVEKQIVELKSGKRLLLLDGVSNLYEIDHKVLYDLVINSPVFIQNEWLITLSKYKINYIKNKYHIEIDQNNNLAFTELGFYFLSRYIETKISIQTNVFIMDSFCKFRDLSRIIDEISKTDHDLKRKILVDKCIDTLFEMVSREANNPNENIFLKTN